MLEYEVYSRQFWWWLPSSKQILLLWDGLRADRIMLWKLCPFCVTLPHWPGQFNPRIDARPGKTPWDFEIWSNNIWKLGTIKADVLLLAPQKVQNFSWGGVYAVLILFPSEAQLLISSLISVRYHIVTTIKYFLVCLCFSGLFLLHVTKRILTNTSGSAVIYVPFVHFWFFNPYNFFWFMIADNTPGSCQSMSLVIMGTQGNSKSFWAEIHPYS